MALAWSTRRQTLYYGVAAVVLLILAALGWKLFFTNVPTCSDGVQNGTEIRVDCGGDSCSLLCPSQVRLPAVRWARAFSTDTHLYTAAAYIENQNTGAGARAVKYSFKLYDQDNVLVVERDGVADLAPMPLIPIVETNINVGNRIVARTLFSFSDIPVWNKISKSLPQVQVANQNLEPDGSRLSATLTNNSLEDTGRITVAAVLFDSQGIARAASKTIINKISRKSSQPIVFTWPVGVPDIIRAEMTVIPSF